jgi:nitrogen fixation protein NifU and related proteins
MLTFSPEMMREIIMDHYSTPLHKKKPENPSEYFQVRMDSTSCIDDITVYIKVIKDKIVDAMFDGVACTISTASTDIMCDLVIGKTLKEAENIFTQYTNMIYEKPYDSEVLGEALVFINTSKQAARIKCATIGWNGLEKIMKEDCHDEEK